MREHLRQDSFGRALIDRYCDPEFVLYEEGETYVDGPASTNVANGKIVFRFLKAPPEALAYLVAHELAHVVRISDEDFLRPNLGMPTTVPTGKYPVTSLESRTAEIYSLAWHIALLRTFYVKEDLEAQVENLIVGGGMVFGATAAAALDVLPAAAQAGFIKQLRTIADSGACDIAAFEKEWTRKLALISAHP